MKNKIIISTCKKYEQVCNKLLLSIMKNVDFLSYELWVVTDYELDTEFPINQISYKGEWGKRMLYALDRIQCTTFLLVLDDFIFEKFDSSKLNDLFFLIENDSDIANIIFEPLHDKINLNFNEDLIIRSQYGRYKTTLQMGLWNTEIFKQILNYKFTPWEFEILGNSKSFPCSKKFLCVKNADKSPIKYNYGYYIVQGHVNKREAERLSSILKSDFLNVGLPVRDVFIKDDIDFLAKMKRRIKIEFYKIYYFIKSKLKRR